MPDARHARAEDGITGDAAVRSRRAVDCSEGLQQHLTIAGREHEEIKGPQVAAESGGLLWVTKAVDTKQGFPC